MIQFQAEVTGLTSTGEAVVRDESGRVFFVAGAYPGDRIVVEPTKLGKGMGLGRLVQIDSYSPLRVAPENVGCALAGFGPTKCGGCPLMGLQYQAQLDYKSDRLQRAMHRNRLSAPTAAPLEILAAPELLSYRNRARFHFDKTNFGFCAHQSSQIVDVPSCPVLEPELNQHLQKARLLSRDREGFYEVDSQSEAPINKSFMNVRRPFQQGNTRQNQVMRQWVQQQLATLTPSVEGIHAVELFCGQGNFTQVLVEAGVARLIAIENDPLCIESIRKFAKGVASFYAIDLYRTGALRELRAKVRDSVAAEVQLLFLDPPRAGEKELPEIMALFPKLRAMVYVSCDEESWARDVRLVCEKYPGWRLERLAICDQFPHTVHLEVLSLLVLD